MSHHHHHCFQPSSVSQTMDEMEFERGIWYAAQYNDSSRVQHLLDNGFSVNAQDSAGYTALHYAVRNGHLDICRMLLRSGADVNAVTRSGQASSLHRAVTADRMSIVDLLLEWHADPYLQDSDGKTILHRAAESGNQEMINEIIKKFPNLVFIKDFKGNVPNVEAKRP